MDILEAAKRQAYCLSLGYQKNHGHSERQHEPAPGTDGCIRGVDFPGQAVPPLFQAASFKAGAAQTAIDGDALDGPAPALREPSGPSG
jgi:hypothetical protein